MLAVVTCHLNVPTPKGETTHSAILHALATHSRRLTTRHAARVGRHESWDRRRHRRPTGPVRARAVWQHTHLPVTRRPVRAALRRAPKVRPPASASPHAAAKSAVPHDRTTMWKRTPTPQRGRRERKFAFGCLCRGRAARWGDERHFSRGVALRPCGAGPAIRARPTHRPRARRGERVGILSGRSRRVRMPRSGRGDDDESAGSRRIERNTCGRPGVVEHDARAGKLNGRYGNVTTWTTPSKTTPNAVRLDGHTSTANHQSGVETSTPRRESALRVRDAVRDSERDDGRVLPRPYGPSLGGPRAATRAPRPRRARPP